MFWPSLQEPFRLPKLAAAEALALLSCAGLCLRWRFRTLREVAEEPAVRVVLPIGLAILISGLGTDHLDHWWEASRTACLGLLALVVWGTTLTKEEIRRLLVWTVPPAIVSSVLVLLQFSGLLQPFSFQGRVGDRLALTALAGGPFDLSAWLLLPALVLQDRLRERGSSSRTTLFLWGCLIVIVAGSVVTQTLSSLIALLAGSVVLWWIHGERRRLGVALGVVGVVALFALVTVDPLRDRLADKWSEIGSGGVDELLTGRLDGWKAAGWMWSQSPVNGVGHGGFRAEFGAAKGDLWREGQRQFFRQHQNSYFVNAHNEALEILAEWGTCGLFLVVIALLAAGARARRTATAFEVAVLVSTALVALVNFPFRIAMTAYPLLLVAAGLVSRRDEEEIASAEAESAPVPVFVIALAFVVGTIHGAGLRAEQMSANRVLFGAEALVGKGSSVPRPWLEAALRQLDEVRDQAPADVRFSATRGDLFMILGRPAAAIREYRRAMELEPRPEVQANLALALFQVGRSAEAEREALWAMRIDPALRRRMRRTHPDLWQLIWRRELRGASPDEGAAGNETE